MHSNPDTQKTHVKSIAIEGVVLLYANVDCLVAKVFPQDDLEVSTSVGFVFSFQIMSKHFKMYITITDVV